MAPDFSTRTATKSDVIAPGSAPLPELDEDSVVEALDLLAHWWSRPIADEVLTWLRAADLEEHVRGVMPVRPEPLSASIDDATVLLDEHERLFVGPGPVPCSPYESYWREDVPVDIRRTLMGPCTADLRHLYGELGLELASASGELPDHVAVEFEAIAYALSLDGVDAIARSLFSDHLRKWLPRLCRAVAHEAGHPFYRELADVTLSWLGPLECYFESIVASAPPTR